MRILPAVVTTALCLCSTSAVFALEYDVTLTNDSEYTTNTGLTNEDEVSEWIHSPGIGLQATHEGPSLNLDVDYNINRRIHQEDLFDNDTESAGTASVAWDALPERLAFTASHTRTQTAIRTITGGATPDNLQENSETTAGPTLRFNPRGQDQILLSYLYGSRTANVTDTDAITHDSSLSYVLVTSPTNSVAFAAMVNQVQYENPFIPDIEYQIGQVTLDRELSNLEYTFTGGYKKAERTLGREDLDDFIFDLQADWQARPGTEVGLTLQHDIQDQSSAIGTGEFEEDLDLPADSDLAEIFTNDRLALTVSQRLNESTSMTFGADYVEEDYEDVGRDTTRQALRVGLSRSLTRQVSASLDLSFENEEFEDEGEEADILRGDLRFDYDVGRNLTTALTIRYEERDSDATTITSNYDVWSAIITLRYSLFNGATR